MLLQPQHKMLGEDLSFPKQTLQCIPQNKCTVQKMRASTWKSLVKEFLFWVKKAIHCIVGTLWVTPFPSSFIISDNLNLPTALTSRLFCLYEKALVQRCSIKKCFQNFEKSAGKQLCQNLDFDKVADWKLATL